MISPVNVVADVDIVLSLDSVLLFNSFSLFVLLGNTFDMKFSNVYSLLDDSEVECAR